MQSTEPREPALPEPPPDEHDPAAATVGDLPVKPGDLGQIVCPDYPKHRVVKKLLALFEDIEEPAETPERAREDLLAFVKFATNGPKPPPYRGARPEESDATRRLRLIARAVNDVPAMRDRLLRTTDVLTKSGSAHRALTQLGIPNARGLWEETTDRLSRALLPTPQEPDDLGESLARLFTKRKHALWLSELEDDLARSLGAALAPAFASMKETAREAIVILATTVSALGLGRDIRDRSPPCPVRESPFFRLSRMEPTSEMRELTTECRAVLPVVRENLEQAGVSLDVVYRLDVIEKSLTRIEALLGALDSNDRDHLVTGARLVGQLALARLDDRRIREVGRTHLRLLARKVIERNGQSGEHYITTTRVEWLKLLLSAGGGGFLTAGTTVLKFLIKWAHFPPLIDAMLASTNYALSFLFMQLLGFTLATKQPSMTAAALADSIKIVDDPNAPRMSRHDGHARSYDLESVVSMIAAMFRSQIVSIIGNLSFVIPTAIAIDLAHLKLTGHHFLDADTSTHVLEAFHITHSGTLWYASFTGVLLWLSSLGAGWFENWVVYRRIPQGIADHRLKRIFGKRIMRWLGDQVAKKSAGIGGNVSIGFLLGMVPVLGPLLGLPIDVRHVTLSTGSATFAAMALGGSTLTSPEFLGAAAGIASMGVLNVLVSLVLALAVALDAREVTWGTRGRLLVAVLKRLVRSPLEFLVPPKNTKGSSH